MTPVYDHSEAVQAFVSRGLWGDLRGFGPAFGLGFADESGLTAGVVYHNYQPDAGVIEISAYSDRRDWLKRDFLRAIFSYPFEQLNCRLVVARISERNARTLRIWRAFGADLHSIPELRGPNEAEVIAVLSREAWASGKFSRA